MTAGAPQKVLVAGDDPINREVPGELLNPEYTVLLAKNGAQTLEKAARLVPALQARDLLEALARAIEQLTIPHAASPVAPVLTVSVGATLGDCGDESAAQQLEAVDS